MRKTEDALCIGDWRSVVCASDLLNFAFCTSLFGPKSHHLWQILRPICQAKGVQRGVIARDLRDLRILRNRVAHYEPIIALPLAQRYASITTLTGWLSHSAATWIAKYSTWPTLYQAGPTLCTDPAYGSFPGGPGGLPCVPS